MDLIETEIIKRLQPLNAIGIAVEAFPSDPKRLERATPNRLVLVRYQGSESSRPAGNSPGTHAPIIQRRLVRYEILLLIKDLRTHENVYPVRDEVINRMVGYVPPNQKWAFYHLKDGWMAQTEGIWFYSQLFELPTVLQSA